MRCTPELNPPRSTARYDQTDSRSGRTVHATQNLRWARVNVSVSCKLHDGRSGHRDTPNRALRYFTHHHGSDKHASPPLTRRKAEVSANADKREEAAEAPSPDDVATNAGAAAVAAAVNNDIVVESNSIDIDKSAELEQQHSSAVSDTTKPVGVTEPGGTTDKGTTHGNKLREHGITTERDAIESTSAMIEPPAAEALILATPTKPQDKSATGDPLARREDRVRLQYQHFFVLGGKCAQNILQGRRS